MNNIHIELDRQYNGTVLAVFTLSQFQQRPEIKNADNRLTTHTQIQKGQRDLTKIDLYLLNKDVKSTRRTGIEIATTVEQIFWNWGSAASGPHLYTPYSSTMQLHKHLRAVPLVTATN